FAEPTVEHRDARGIDAAVGDQVISSARHEQLCLADAAGATTVSDDVGRSRRIVLQCYRQVVETGFLIVKRATAANVKLRRRMFAAFGNANQRRGLRSLAAGSFARAIVDN